MGITALRALAHTVGWNMYGVPAAVTLPGEAAVQTTAVWLTPLQDEMPIGRDFHRREPRRVMALRVSAVGSSVPRGTTIEAAEHGGAARTWRVDGLERQDAEQIRVIVVPV